MTTLYLPPIQTAAVSIVAAQRPLNPRALLPSPPMPRPACMLAATNPGHRPSGGNGRMLDFSREFVRKTVGQPVEVLHYQDASLHKATLDRELAPTREAKAALRLQRRAEVVARCQQRKQHQASRRSNHKRAPSEADALEGRVEKRQAAMIVQKLWRRHLTAPIVADDGSRVLDAAEQAALREQLYHSSLALIQSWMRRCIARKRAERARREGVDDLLDRACITIQAYSRRRRALLRMRALAAYRRIESDMDAITELWAPRLQAAAATHINKVARGSLARKQHANRRACAPSSRRLLLLGTMHNDMRATRAALRIQSMYRGKQVREKHGKRRRGKGRTARVADAPPTRSRPGLGRRGSQRAIEHPQPAAPEPRLSPPGPHAPTAPAVPSVPYLPPPAAPGTWQATPPAGATTSNPRRRKVNI